MTNRIPSQEGPQPHPTADTKETGKPIRKGKPSLRIEIPAAIPSIRDASNPLNEKNIRGELNKIELEQKYTYVSKYEFDEKNVECCLSKLYPQSSIKTYTIGLGTTGAQIVEVDGRPRYILKKVAPRPELFDEAFYQEALHKKLQENPEASLKEKVSAAFITHSFEGFENPYLIEAQREKLAYVMGKDIGVPKVQLIVTQDGIFSLHDFVDEPSGLKADVMDKIAKNQVDLSSLQIMTIFDMVAGNRDRNGGNFLVSKESGKLIPLDHALILRTKGADHRAGIQIGHFLPLWFHDPIMEQPLTPQARDYILQLDFKNILEECEKNYILLDTLAKQELDKNIEMLKKALLTPPEPLSLKELYERFYQFA